MAGMDHTAMSGMEHASMPGMKHDGSMSAMPGMQTGSNAAGAHTMTGMEHMSKPGVTPVPMAGMKHDGVMAAMQHDSLSVRPQLGATLRADEFDAPSPVSIDEAAKGTSGMTHSKGGVTPSRQEQHPPLPPSHHGNEDEL